MNALKLACEAMTRPIPLLLCVCSLLCAPAPGEESIEPVVPPISESQRTYLSRVAYRTVRDAMLQREPYQLGYVPAALNTLNAEVMIRLRQGGYLLSGAFAGPSSVAQATRDAALTAARMLLADRTVDADTLPRLLIEVEVVGPAEPIHIEGDWTRPRALDPYIEPGVHGMVVAGPLAQHRFCPTEIFTNDRVLADVLNELAKTTHRDSSELDEVRLMRFRTAHWVRDPSSDKVVSLHRGLTIVPPDTVTPAGLDTSISKLADYMAYRQLESGLFSYEYQPGLDRYTDGNNLVRQVGAAYAMAVHARRSGKSGPRAAADLAIRYHLQGLTDVPGLDDAAFLATADGTHKLGVTALLCCALSQHPDPAPFAPARRKLIRGILWLQRPSGMFITAFPPAERVTAQDYFPGEALLALAMHYEHEPSAEVLEAFDRAIEFYRAYFRDRPSPAFVPWQVQAYTRMARLTKRSDYVTYVFELTDWLADKQLTESNCRWPELWGGIAPYQPGRAGVATAAYLEGFADALELARSTGDAERVQRYERLVRRAARFVMQLQVRPEEAYFIRSPIDAVGGIRTTPSLNLLRIDHAQHALVGLIRSRQALYPDEG